MPPSTILVTGSSSGTGRACIELFLRHGWNVAATAREPAALAGLPESDRLSKLKLDVTDRQSISEAVARAEEQFGSIDVLVNNAGIGLAGPIETVKPEELQRHFATNVFGLVAVTQAVLPGMRTRGRGLIINVGSVAGRFGLPFLSPYNASKFAVEGLSESWQFELKRSGVRVKLIEPGGTTSNFAHEWSLDASYEPELGMARASTKSADLPGPEVVARVIYAAAHDRSDRLRYTAAGGGAFLALHRLLPASIWRKLIEKRFAVDRTPT